MKRLLILIGFSVFWACNDSAGLDNKADSLGKEADSFSKKVGDSTGKRAKELKENIKDQFKDRDTIKQ